MANRNSKPRRPRLTTDPGDTAAGVLSLVEVPGALALRTRPSPGELLPIPDWTTSTNRKNPGGEAAGVLSLVEVPGIEPGSFVASMGLLRAQCASSLLGLTDHAHKSV